MSFKNVLGGYKAKAMGEAFENLFKSICERHSVVCVRIPNGARTFKFHGKLVTKPAKSPFDFFITKEGRSACLDAKTIEDGNFSFACIDPKQVDRLLETSRSIPSGYVVWYRKIDMVYFYSALTLKNLTPKSSLKVGDGLLLGSISTMNPEKIFDWKESGTNILSQQRIF